ncbi:MAG: transporter substrate-binding domain-containing protein [Lachnospiraceae bacterium]|nr:transporter substrate-binding domain-containing protein [Lachnospiraceae bacterium]
MNRRIVLLILLMAFSCLIFSSCSKNEKVNKIKAPDNIAEFNDPEVTVGVVDGYIYEDVVKRQLPDANIKLFSTREIAYKALLTGAVSGVVDDEPIIRAIIRSTDVFYDLDGYVEEADYAFAFPKNSRGNQLRAQFDEYVDILENTGGLKKLDDKWFGSETDNKTSESFESLNGTKGTITFAYDGENVPFEYMSANKAVGYEIDLLIGFCKKYGYKVSARKMAFSDMLDSVAAGKVDMASSAITVTDERSERMSFSRPCYSGGVSIAVNSDKVKEYGKSKATGISYHFKKAFIEKDRYMLILKGLLITILIVFFAVLIGTPLGYILYIISRRSNLVVRGIVRAFIWLVNKTPAIMIIMLVYYKYYTDLTLGGIAAAIVGFSLCFSEEMYRIIETYVARVDDGKLEKDYRLWFSKSSDFFKELFSHFRNDIINDFSEKVVLLVKETAVVGYIAVYDLTKVLETIRVDSLELTFPLLMTTLIYIVLIAIISRFLKSFIKE